MFFPESKIGLALIYIEFLKFLLIFSTLDDL